MSIFKLFQKIVRTGQVVTITLRTLNGGKELVSGVLTEIISEGCIIDTIKETRFISCSDIISWNIEKFPTDPSKLQESTNKNVVEMDERLIRLKEQFEKDSINIPRFSHPKPIFKIKGISEEFDKKINRWRNRYNYAKKISELNRLCGDVAEINSLANLTGSSELYFLAGYFAYLCGDSPQKYYKKAVEQGYLPAAKALAAFSVEVKDWDQAMENLIYLVYRLENDEEIINVIRILSQCVMRIKNRDPQKIKAMIDKGLNEDASILVLKLYDMAKSNVYIKDNDNDRGINHKKEKPDEKISEVKNKPTMTLKSLSELSKLVLPEIEEENQLLVPANGQIIRYYYDKRFGFLVDMKGNEYYFHLNDIIDDGLALMLNDNSKTKFSIPVIYTESSNYKGKKAVTIQKVAKVSVLLDRAKNKKDSDIRIATNIADQVLNAYPDNYSAQELKKKILSIKTYKLSPKRNLDDLNYRKATNAKNVEKDYNKALKYYFLALENNEKRESCIKDIAMLYISMEEMEEAGRFMNRYENELPRNVTNYNFLENFFYATQNFEKALEYYNYLLNKTSVKKDKRKYSMYLSKRGLALIKLDKLKDAKRSLLRATEIEPENSYAQRLLLALEQPDSDELNKAIADAEFSSFGGGLSKLIKDTLEEYEEYYGVPAKIIDKGNFDVKTLADIRKIKTTAGRTRPRERANYLLTEAKLMQLLEPEKDINLRIVLAEYCKAMAYNHASEYSSMDVIRNYYLEAFRLEEKFEKTELQVALYLISHKSSYSDLLSTHIPTIDDALRIILKNDVKDFIWEGILSMFLWNRSISAQIIQKLYNEKLYKEKSIYFLKRLGIIATKEVNINDYTNMWNQAREVRQRDYSKWLAFIKAIYNNESIEKIIDQFFNSIDVVKTTWLTQLDKTRLDAISTDIIDVLNQYLGQLGYRDKERYYGFAKSQINQLIMEIKERPTKLSYEGFIPLLQKIDFLLDKSFKTIEDASTPKVKVNVLNDLNVVGSNNIVEFQVNVENLKDSSPIRNIKVFIEKADDIKFLSENYEHYGSIDGGENYIFKLLIQVSEKVRKDAAATLDIVCEYKIVNQDKPVSVKTQLPLHLYSEDEFEIIKNPYSPNADGGPVEDKKMFYGRDEFINNRIAAILDADSKQIIIYGQKRSGKSSVLLHLKRGLESTDKTFCVSFSLGLIVKELNEFTFYHKILSSIEKELRIKRIRKETVPDFYCPTYEEFRTKYESNPADGFIELIENFQLTSIQLDGWKDKKLVVMIDEFTYLYTAIRNGTTSDSIMKQWKAITQNENAKFSVVLVGQDVVPIFKNQDYARNAFGVIEDIRLTYLDESDARRLIEEPILDKSGESRYIGRAVDTIIDYTSRNPYYIQIFCARLVDYMNAKKIVRVTEADIKDVAETFINGNQALAPEKFDNLIRAGEEHDFKEFSDEPIIKILRQIAISSKNIGFCSRDNISLGDKELEDKILNHLTDREVLERRQGDNYKIQVRLFREWLLKN